MKKLLIIQQNYGDVKVVIDRVTSQEPHPKRKKVKKLRKDLVFRYLNSIETSFRRLDGQLLSDSYKNLVSDQSPYFGLTDTELEFIIERLETSHSLISELVTKLREETEKRNIF